MGSFLKICRECKNLIRFMEDREGLCEDCLAEAKRVKAAARIAAKEVRFG